ncbi:hypothetical protein LLY42_02165 [Pseudomonas frederiksbergensis]|nr:hypothetical protein LLY42_02165 [Pseudomonas frederiksbergensis]
MTEQVQLPPLSSLVQSPSKNTKESSTRILAITNGDGELIENGGISKNGDLSFVGSAEPNQTAEILDKGVPVHPPVNVDNHGHYSAFLPGQTMGEHAYSVRTSDGKESEVWFISMDVPVVAHIQWVTGPDGVPIHSGGSTVHSSLSFVGQGVAFQTVDLLDRGELLQTLNVDGNNHWSALVENVSEGNHEYTVRGEGGDVSAPWRIRVNKPAELTVQFVIGASFRLIGNHEPTTDKKLTLVGTAIPGESGFIVDYERDLVPFVADQNGVYTATIEGLAEKVHTFRAKSDQGRVSMPWAIRVVGSKARHTGS